MRFVPLLLILAFNSAIAGVHESSDSWPLEYRDESTNRFRWDKRTEPLIESRTHRSFATELASALGGPPGPVVVEQNRYFTASACVPHDCGRQGFLWLDLDEGSGLGAIFRRGYPRNEGPLELDSRQIRGAVPDGARLSIVRWLGEHKAIPTSVEFTDATGIKRSLPLAAFQPPQGFMPPGGGPSFDCARAGTRIESVLCGDPELAALDLKMSDEYGGMLLSLSDMPMRRQLTALQKNWLQRRDSVCEYATAPKECLAAEYRSQADALQHWIPLPSSPQDLQGLSRSGFQSGSIVHHGAQRFVLRRPDANERTASFNTELAAHGMAAVDSCALLVDLPVGTAHGNHSYGAVCSQPAGPNKHAVMICDDEMIGHFGYRALDGRNKVSVEALAHFVAEECFGG